MLPHDSPEPDLLPADFRISFGSRLKYVAGVSIVRILIDGYSLLHAWPELTAGRPPHAAESRDALVRVLRQYQDSVRTPITVFFDGPNARIGTDEAVSTAHLEILFSKAGQTADSLIERTVQRLQPYGEPLVITNDRAERHTVHAFGAATSDCGNFIREIEAQLNSLQVDVTTHNRNESRRYRRSLASGR